MKRVGFIYEKIYDKENIRLAIQKASRKKKNKRAVKRVNNNIDYYIDKIHNMLKNKTYVPSPYRIGIIKDGPQKKERLVHKPKFYPDQIIHWCLMLVVEPMLKKSLYHWSCASISKRGTHYAKCGIEKWIKNDFKNTKYVLKLDITKYYPSVNQELLKQKFRSIIKDKDALQLIDIIINSIKKGLPIGNYTSQWFANFNLQEIDYYIKQELKIKYYVRYMDDLVLFGSNKRKLRNQFELLKSKIENECLKVKMNWQIFPIDKRPLDFCGFVFTREKTFVRKQITKRMRKKYYKFKKNENKHNAQSLLSYFGWLVNSNSYILFKKYFSKNFKRIKEIANESTMQYQT